MRAEARASRSPVFWRGLQAAGSRSRARIPLSGTTHLTGARPVPENLQLVAQRPVDDRPRSVTDHTRGTIFRVFISSTFADFVEERAALEADVFPRLRQLCQERGARFQAIDLRWGISAEASLDQRTMRVCFEELARCQRLSPRPNFIILLGDRYGWRPLPAAIPGDEWEVIRSCCSPAEMTALCEWYQRDDNAARRCGEAVVPEWVLGSRAGRCEDETEWRRIEARLLAIIDRAKRSLPAPASSQEVDPRLKYGASATEQEVHRGALAVSDASEHVFGFFRRITNLDSLIGDAASVPQARDYADFDPDKQWAHDLAAHERVLALQRTLRDRLPGQTETYDSFWDGNEARLVRPDLARFCADVLSKLTAVILAESKRYADITPWQREVARHSAFAGRAASCFVGRDEALVQIEQYVRCQARHPLLLWAPPGSGKSAVMAEAARRTREECGRAVIVERYVGATAASTRLQTLLASMCEEIASVVGGQVDVSGSPAELVQEFVRCLASGQPDAPLVVFLDGLEKLSEDAASRDMAWIPPATQMPDHLRLVLSVAAHEDPRGRWERLREADGCALPQMTESEGDLLLDAWLSQAERTLAPSQRKVVLGAFRERPSPLYLRLAFEEAREWHALASAGDAKLAADERGLVMQRLDRLSRPSRHGPKLVERSLAFLASSRGGLAEEELLAALCLDAEVIAELRSLGRKSPAVAHVPPVVWARLYSDLEPYLSDTNAPGAAVLTVRDQTVADVIRERYLSDPQERRRRHAVLSSLFCWPRPPVSDNDPRSVPAETRRLYESAFQSAAAGDWPSVHERLTEPGFLSRMCEAVDLGVDRMLADLQDAQGAWPREAGDAGPAVPDRAEYEALYSQFWAESSRIRRYRTLAFQQLWHRVRWASQVGTECRRRFDAHAAEVGRGGRTLLRSRTPPSDASGARVQEIRFGDRPGPVALAMSPLGLLVMEQSGRWSILDAGGAVRHEGVGGPAGLRKLCANDSHIAGLVGQNVALWGRVPTERPFLFRTGWPISALDLAAASPRLLVAGDGGEWLLYDLAPARPARIREGAAPGQISAAAIAPDGRQWLLAGAEGQVWRASTDAGVELLFRHGGTIRALSLSPGGQRYAATLGNGRLEIVDRGGGLCFRSDPGLCITDAVIDDRGQVVIAVDEQGRCLRFSGAMDWQVDVLSETASYASWVRPFPGWQALASLQPDGALRIQSLSETTLTATTSDALPHGAVVGVAPLPEGEALLAEGQGTLWRIPAGDVTTALRLGSAGSALRALHGTRSHSGLLVFHGRSHSYLASWSGTEAPVNLGPPEELAAYSVFLEFSSVSPDGRYALTGCRTVEGGTRTRLQVFTVSPWRRIWERWIDGWCGDALIADSGRIVVDAGWYQRPYSISLHDDHETPGPFETGGPLAVDTTGLRVLLTDGARNAWLVLNGLGSPPISLGQEIHAGSLSADGRIGVVIDTVGFVRMFEVRDGMTPTVRWMGAFPLGWSPRRCALLQERREIWAWGSRGFTALVWDAPSGQEVKHE